MKQIKVDWNNPGAHGHALETIVNDTSSSSPKPRKAGRRAALLLLAGMATAWLGHGAYQFYKENPIDEHMPKKADYNDKAPENKTPAPDVFPNMPAPTKPKPQSPTVPGTFEDAYILVNLEDFSGKKYNQMVSSKDYFALKQKNHTPEFVSDLVNWVDYKDPYVQRMALAITKGHTTIEDKAAAIMSVVNSQKYDVSIEENKEYVKHPLETLVERNGDCEDFAILGAAMMKAVGIDVTLIYIPKMPGQRAGHMVVGVHGKFKGEKKKKNGKKYFYADGTGDGKNDFPIGASPPEEIAAYLYEVN